MSLVNKKGVDLSSSNGAVDFSKIKAAGFDFVMIRCGFGSDITSQDDNQFESNVKKAEALGMPWGAYLYSYALTTAEATSEAQHVLRLLKGKKPSLPIAFDMEDADGYKAKNGMPSNAGLVNICKTFLSTVSKAGYYVSLYASLSWLNNQLKSSDLDAYDKWVAQWNSKCQYTGTYGLWQYGGETNYIESNSIAGVGVVDKNYCYKDYPTIIKAKGLNGFSVSTTPTPVLKELETVGFKRNDNSTGVLAYKELLLLAKKKGITTHTVNEDSVFGDGTEKATNQILNKLGYAQNGIAGTNLIKKLTALIIAAG